MGKPQIDLDEQDDIDLTPMIDIIFLLLIFFILTTKFVPDEKAISNLLPTNKGTANTPPPEVVEPPQDINVRIFPKGITRTMGVQDSDKWWHANKGVGRKTAVLQIGNGDSIEINGPQLGDGSPEQQETEIATIHGYISAKLTEREIAGARKEQSPIVLHCFSGLPWKYAIVAYDAVRSYEAAHGQSIDQSDPDALLEAREIMFAPPRVRDYHTWELGNELWEIVRLK